MNRQTNWQWVAIFLLFVFVCWNKWWLGQLQESQLGLSEVILRLSAKGQRESGQGWAVSTYVMPPSDNNEIPEQK